MVSQDLTQKGIASDPGPFQNKPASRSILSSMNRWQVVAWGDVAYCTNICFFLGEYITKHIRWNRGEWHPRWSGVVPAMRIHLLGQETIRLHHDQRVAGLHGEQEVVVVPVPADLRKLKRRLHHAPASKAPRLYLYASSQAPIRFFQTKKSITSITFARIHYTYAHRGPAPL